MNTPRSRSAGNLAPVLAGVGIFLALLLLYGAVYLAMLDGVTLFNNRQAAATTLLPRYRFGGKAFETIFIPAHAIDRRLRPSTWPDIRVYKYPESSHE